MSIFSFFLSLTPVAPVGLIEALLLDGRPPPVSSTGFRLFIMTPHFSSFALLREAHITAEFFLFI